MSEYQYYEWQSIDRSLTSEEREEVARLSSHVEAVASSHAIATYSWGNFQPRWDESARK